LNQTISITVNWCYSWNSNFCY